MRPLLVRAVLEVAMHKAVSGEFCLERDQPSAVRLQLRAAQRILDNIEEEYGGTLENADLAYFYQISCIVSKLNGQLERARSSMKSLSHAMKSVGATAMLQRCSYY